MLIDIQPHWRNCSVSELMLIHRYQGTKRADQEHTFILQ